MKVTLVVQNNQDSNENWEKSLYFPSEALVPVDYEIYMPMGEKFPYFKVNKGIIFTDVATGNISLKLTHLVNPQVLQEMELKRYGWTKKTKGVILSAVV